MFIWTVGDVIAIAAIVLILLLLLIAWVAQKLSRRNVCGRCYACIYRQGNCDRFRAQPPPKGGEG